MTRVLLCCEVIRKGAHSACKPMARKRQIRIFGDSRAPLTASYFSPKNVQENGERGGLIRRPNHARRVARALGFAAGC